MRYHLLGISVAIVLSVVGCSPADPEATRSEGATAVVVVDGRPIDASVFEAFIKRTAGKTGEDLDEQTRQRLLDQLIGLELAATQARSKGIADKNEVRAQLELVQLSALAEAYVADYLAQHPASPEEIEAEYRVQVEHAPREYKARHILVETRTIAESIVRELDAGADFVALAKQESRDASAATGGDLGWFTLEGMPASFAGALGDLAKGRYTAEPVQSNAGWHVILLEDIRQPEIPALETVLAEVIQVVQRKKAQRHLEALRGASVIQKKE